MVPGIVLDELTAFNDDMYGGKLTIEPIAEKKSILIKQEDDEEELNNLLVKVKFFNLNNPESGEADVQNTQPRLRLQFKKKKGDLFTWYQLFKQMQ